jgi:hypothetical protein
MGKSLKLLVATVAALVIFTMALVPAFSVHKLPRIPLRHWQVAADELMAQLTEEDLLAMRQGQPPLCELWLVSPHDVTLDVQTIEGFSRYGDVWFRQSLPSSENAFADLIMILTPVRPLDRESITHSNALSGTGDRYNIHVEMTSNTHARVIYADLRTE